MNLFRIFRLMLINFALIACSSSNIVSSGLTEGYSDRFSPRLRTGFSGKKEQNISTLQFNVYAGHFSSFSDEWNRDAHIEEFESAQFAIVRTIKDKELNILSRSLFSQPDFLSDDYNFYTQQEIFFTNKIKYNFSFIDTFSLEPNSISYGSIEYTLALTKNSEIISEDLALGTKYSIVFFKIQNDSCKFYLHEKDIK